CPLQERPSGPGERATQLTHSWRNAPVPRKTTKKKPQHPDKPGRFIPGYGDHEASGEHVDIVIDDAQLRKIADELKVLGAKAAEHKETIATAKEELKPVVSRQRL